MRLRQVRQRDWLRFGVFLALLTGMTMYVASRYHGFRQSGQEPAAALPAAGYPAYPEAGQGPAPAAPGTALPVPGAVSLPVPGTPLPAPGAVAAGGVRQPDFFAEYRLERDRARGQEREMLWQVMTGPAGTDEARRQANMRWLALSATMGLEAQLEGLIRGRGFEDAVVFLGEGTAQVVVKAPSLTSQEAARIGELVRQVANVKPTGISIVQRER